VSSVAAADCRSAHCIRFAADRDPGECSSRTGKPDLLGAVPAIAAAARGEHRQARMAPRRSTIGSAAGIPLRLFPRTRTIRSAPSGAPRGSTSTCSIVSAAALKCPNSVARSEASPGAGTWIRPSLRIATWAVPLSGICAAPAAYSPPSHDNNCDLPQGCGKGLKARGFLRDGGVLIAATLLRPHSRALSGHRRVLNGSGMIGGRDARRL
jgi:hypothetical protein